MLSLNSYMDDDQQLSSSDIANTMTKNATERATRKGIRHGAKTTKKVAVGIKNLLSQLIKWISPVLGYLAAALLAIILILSILNGIIASIFIYQSNISGTLTRLSSHAEIITRMFESYIDNTYRQGWYIDYDNGGNMVAASYDSVANDDYDEYLNPVNDRIRYSQVLDYIRANGYEYELAALWDVLVKDTMSPFICNLRHNEYDYMGERRLKNAETVYQGICEFYWYQGQEDLWTGEKNAYSDEELNANGFNGAVIKDIDDTGNFFKIGFYSNCAPEDLYNRAFHQYYTNQYIKVCLEAFINPDGSYIKNKTEITERVKAEEKESVSNTENETDKSGDSSSFYIDYSDKVTDYIYDNFRKSLETHYSLLEKTTTDSKEIIKHTIWQQLVSHYAMQPSTGFENNNYEQFIKDDLKTRIRNTARNNLISSASGSSNIVALAHQQLGNGGQKYCDELNNGTLVDWCCIYAGWLLQRGGGINLSEYGYSAAVPSWKQELKNRGLWIERGSYRPKIGDIAIMNNIGHVGIVIDVSDTGFTTSEGNTAAGQGPGAYCTRSIVSEYTYSYDDTYINGFGKVSIKNTNTSGDFNLSTTSVDSNYKAVSFKQWAGRSLTKKEREILEQTITGEFGSDYTGSCLIAQCLRDALVYGYCDKVENLPSKMRYDGYYAANSKTCDNAKKAVEYVFDNGGVVVQHRIIVMYNPTICTSAWHEQQHYIVTCCDVRFFDYWE